jgi:membrane dipeptidase
VFGELVPDADRPFLLEGIDVDLVVPGLDGPAGMPLVWQALRDAGRPAALVDAVAGENLVRFLRATLDDRVTVTG